MHLFNPIHAAAAGDQVHPGLDRSGRGSSLAISLPSFLQVTPGPATGENPTYPNALVPARLSRVGLDSYADLNGIGDRDQFGFDPEAYVHWASPADEHHNAWNHILGAFDYLLDDELRVIPIRHWRLGWWLFWGRVDVSVSGFPQLDPSIGAWGDLRDDGTLRAFDGGYQPIYGSRFRYFPAPGDNGTETDLVKDMPAWVDVAPWCP